MNQTARRFAAHHVPSDLLGNQHGIDEIYADYTLQLMLGDFKKSLTSEYPGIVDQNIDMSERRDRLFDKLFGLALVCNIACHRMGTPIPSQGCFAADYIGTDGIAEIAEKDAGAFLQETLDQRTANPIRSPGYEDFLSFEFHRSSIPLFENLGIDSTLLTNPWTAHSYT
nr:MULTISPECIES: hypothetical protein [Pseudomonas]